jgi:hypothetical protein
MDFKPYEHRTHVAGQLISSLWGSREKEPARELLKEAIKVERQRKQVALYRAQQKA